MLPQSLTPVLREHLTHVKKIHEKDLADGWGRVLLPDALERKYPNAPAEWRCQWVFPQENRWKNRVTGEEGRHHIHETILQRAVREAVPRGWRGQACRLPHLSPLFCNPFVDAFAKNHKMAKQKFRPTRPGGFSEGQGDVLKGQGDILYCPRQGKNLPFINQ